jgi:hypothetical protein
VEQGLAVWQKVVGMGFPFANDGLDASQATRPNGFHNGVIKTYDIDHSQRDLNLPIEDSSRES